MRIVILAASASLGLGAVLAACTDTEPLPNPSSDGGVESGPADSSAPQDDAGDAAESMCPLPATIGSAKCHACVQSKCCAQLAACNADDGCKAMFLCVSECLPKPDVVDCYDACIATHDGGGAAYTAFDDCVATDGQEGCADDCS